jgi:hypothetical protein
MCTDLESILLLRAKIRTSTSLRVACQDGASTRPWGRLTRPSLITAERHEHLSSGLQLRGADSIASPVFHTADYKWASPQQHCLTFTSAWHPQPRFSLRPCASEALLELKVRMNPMFHEPLTGYQPGSSWSGIALPDNMQHSMIAVPLSGERSYAFWGLKSNQTRFPH